MADKKKTWLSILLAAVIIVGILGVALVGSAAYWFYQHFQTQVISTESAAEEFSRERARFAGQQPLIEIRFGEPPLFHRSKDAVQQGHVELQALHALVYDPVARKLVRANIPFWLLRLAPRGRVVSLPSNVDFDAGRAPFTVEDLERRGPGLILDLNERDLDSHGQREGQILVWTD